MKTLVILFTILFIVSCNKEAVEPKRCFTIEIQYLDTNWNPGTTEKLIEEKCNMTFAEAQIYCNNIEEKETYLRNGYVITSVKIISQQ